MIKPVNGSVLARPLLNQEIIIEHGDNPYMIFDDCINAEVLTDGILFKKGDIVQFHKHYQVGLVQNFMVFNRYELPEYNCDFLFLLEEITTALGGIYGYYRGIKVHTSNDLNRIPYIFDKFNLFDRINMVELDVNISKTRYERGKMTAELRKASILNEFGVPLSNNQKLNGIDLSMVKVFDRSGIVIKGELKGKSVILHKNMINPVKVGNRVVVVVNTNDIAFIQS